MIKELLKKNRSYRRFYQNIRISEEELKDIVDAVRYCASGRNAQALKYAIISDEQECAKVYETLAWAGYLKDWDGPIEGERPSAYLIQVLDTQIVENCLCDDGLHLEALSLVATEKGYGCCIIKSFKNENLRNILKLKDEYKITYVLALGKAKEIVVLEDIKDNDIKYWRSNDEIHHVPKRALDEIIIPLN